MADKSRSPIMTLILLALTAPENGLTADNKPKVTITGTAKNGRAVVVTALSDEMRELVGGLTVGSITSLRGPFNRTKDEVASFTAMWPYAPKPKAKLADESAPSADQPEESASTDMQEDEALAAETIAADVPPTTATMETSVATISLKKTKRDRRARQRAEAVAKRQRLAA